MCLCVAQVASKLCWERQFPSNNFEVCHQRNNIFKPDIDDFKTMRIADYEGDTNKEHTHAYLYIHTPVREKKRMNDEW